MSKTEPTPGVETVVPVEEQAFSGLAIQKTNIRMNKLSHVMKEVRIFTDDNKDITINELTKLLYPDWELMTQDKFENQEWYVGEKLLPLLEKSPTDVYQEALEEEQAKLLSIDDAKDKFTW